MKLAVVENLGKEIAESVCNRINMNSLISIVYLKL